jgi:hypothetical protein
VVNIPEVSAAYVQLFCPLHIDLTHLSSPQHCCSRFTYYWTLPTGWYRFTKITEGHSDFIFRVKKPKDITVLGLCDSDYKGTKIVVNIGKYFPDGTE